MSPKQGNRRSEASKERREGGKAQTPSSTVLDTHHPSSQNNSHCEILNPNPSPSIPNSSNRCHVSPKSSCQSSSCHHLSLSCHGRLSPFDRRRQRMYTIRTEQTSMYQAKCILHRMTSHRGINLPRWTILHFLGGIRYLSYRSR